MTRTLQKRFIVTAMIAITVLLLAVLGVLNIVNAVSTGSQAERLVQVLLRDESNRPSGERPDGISEATPQGRRASGSDVFDLENFTGDERRELEDFMGRGGLFAGELTENDARSAVYFTVRFYEDGSTYADVSRIADVTEDEAAALAVPLFAAGASAGTSGGYRFAGTVLNDGVTLYVFLSTANQSAAVLRIALLSVLLGMAAWGLMLLLVILLSKRAIRPIAENMEKQRSFVTDAGHEIKTPLAIIQANTEAMELRTGENKYTKNIREQVTRLGGLMQDLLTLAKADESRTAETATVFSLSELVEATGASFQAPMELRGLTLESEIVPELTIRGDRALLTRLVSILMDNAVKYASENSTLHLTLARTERHAVLTLANTCDALPACAPEKLFDRFYRADEARTQKTGGYGIGLASARAIAEAHRGSISAEYSKENLITFTVKLPIK